MGLNVALDAFDDTAGAAEYVAANGLRVTATIASAWATELYGSQILADGIQDNSSNVTRFVMMAREPIIPRTDRPFKTSIVFAQTAKAPRFSSRCCRPSPSGTSISPRSRAACTAKHFEYMFCVDFQASMAELCA